VDMVETFTLRRSAMRLANGGLRDGAHFADVLVAHSATDERGGEFHPLATGEPPVRVHGTQSEGKTAEQLGFWRSTSAVDFGTWLS
jgi:hypothetical protein